MLPDYNEKYYAGIIAELNKLNSRLENLRTEQILLNKKLDTLVRDIERNGYKLEM